MNGKTLYHVDTVLENAATQHTYFVCSVILLVAYPAKRNNKYTSFFLKSKTLLMLTCMPALPDHGWGRRFWHNFGWLHAHTHAPAVTRGAVERLQHGDGHGGGPRAWAGLGVGCGRQGGQWVFRQLHKTHTILLYYTWVRAIFWLLNELTCLTHTSLANRSSSLH